MASTPNWMKEGAPATRMTNIFVDQPEFISTDPRRNLPVGKRIGYKITPEVMLLRHQSLLPQKLIDGKRVLDLGCCTGASGAWCLSQGAAFYTGVEINEEFVRQSSICLTKYYDKSKWRIEPSSIDDFLDSREDKFDVIFASGVVHGSADPIKLLTQISKKTDCVVIESVHQYALLRRLTDATISAILKDPQIVSCLENASYITVGTEGMIGGQAGKQIMVFNGFNPSMGALKFIFNSFGFIYDDAVNQALKKQLPEIFNPFYRFGTLFRKHDNAKTASYGFTDTVGSPENIIKKIDWENL
jgi:SAM-dependent methyltransferase